MAGGRTIVCSLIAGMTIGLEAQPVAQDLPRVGRDGYRDGVPMVLTPPRPRPRPAPPPETPFAAAYRRAGHPRLVLFFNREIADVATSEIVLRRQDVARSTRDGGLSVHESGAGDVSAQATIDAAAFGRQPRMSSATEASPDAARRRGVEMHDRVEAEHRTEVSVQRQAVGSRSAPLDEASQWLFETSFTARLATEHVRMVDRATALRLASTTRGLADPQQLETAAIREHADIVVLVRATSMPTPPGGQIFRITALDTRGGTIVADEIVTPPAGGSSIAQASAAGDMAAASLVTRMISAWAPPR